MQNKTRRMYLKLAKMYPSRIVTINGNQDINAIHLDIWNKIEILFTEN